MKYLSKICSFCTTHRYPSPVSLIAISHHASQSFSRYNYHDNSFYSWSAHDLSSVSITGGSHRYLSSVHPHLSSVSLICITHRYLSPVSLIGISHHVTHLNYVWRICCQVNHFRDIVITITHFLLKVRTWSICKKYVIHAISTFQKMQHLCSEMPILLSAPRECSGRRQKPNAFYNFWWGVNFALLQK